MKLVNEIVLEFAKIQLFEPTLVKVEIFGNVIIAYSETKAINDAIGLLSDYKEILLLIVADELAQFDKSANEYSASKEGMQYSIAEAIVVKNLAQKILANFYLSFNKPIKPTKLFSSEKDALDWLFSIA